MLTVRCKVSPANDLALSVTFGDSSPKGRALGSSHRLYLFAKASPFGRGGTAQAVTERARPQLENRLFPFAPPPVKIGLKHSAELVRAKPFHLLAQTALPLKSPTGAFIAAQTRSLQTRNYKSFFRYRCAATRTTAASGGNREELLGQRSARRKCRPRHEADAGCRNPEEAEHILNRFTARFVWTSP